MVLLEGPIVGRAFAGEHLQSRAVGCNGEFKPGGAGFQLPQASQCSAEVALDCRPVTGFAFTRKEFQSCAVGGDGLVEPLGAALSAGQVRQGEAEGVLCSGPLNRCVPPRIGSECSAVGVDGLFESIRAGFPRSERRVGVSECDVQGGAMFGATDGGSAEQSGELFCSGLESFLQYMAACFGVRERGYGVPRHRCQLSPEILVKVGAKCRLFQSVGPVSPSKRPVALARHEP